MDSRRNFNRYNRTMPNSYNRMPVNNSYDNEVMTPCSSAEQELTAYSLSMVYAPKQCFGSLYELNYALNNGTIFKELNLPFAPGKRG